MKKILILHGPNLNLLGQRETNYYGQSTLAEINQQLINHGQQNKVLIECFQSNNEFELIDITQQSINTKIDFLIINPAGLTHTSIIWRDALLAINIPFVEVHISNIFAREQFRHKSFFSDIALGVITGFGHQGYLYALNFAINYLHNIN